MQVVINRNSGGFALTDAALLEVYKQDPASAALTVMRPEDVAADSFFDEMFYVQAPDGNFVRAAPETALARACPTLVSVVRRMGSESHGKRARLDVVEIHAQVKAYSDWGDELPLSRGVRLVI